MRPRRAYVVFLLQDTFKVVDCYLSEGPKVLIRFGIAFLKMCSKELMKAMSGAYKLLPASVPTRMRVCVLGVVILPIFSKQCVHALKELARESLGRDNLGELTALHACGSASPFRARCRHRNHNW
jgi:hypothetical protein